jgi:hypothetical protein
MAIMPVRIARLGCKLIRGIFRGIARMMNNLVARHHALAVEVIGLRRGRTRS